MAKSLLDRNKHEVEVENDQTGEQQTLNRG